MRRRVAITFQAMLVIVALTGCEPPKPAASGPSGPPPPPMEPAPIAPLPVTVKVPEKSIAQKTGPIDTAGISVTPGTERNSPNVGSQAPTAAQIDEAVARALEAKAAERRKKLADLDKRESLEIGPLETAINNIEREITDYQQKYDRLKSQMTNSGRAFGFPKESFGVPSGTRFSPGVDGRMKSEIDNRARNQMAELNSAYEQKMAELQKKMERAESALESKQRELARLRQEIITGL